MSWTSNRQVAGLTATQALLHNNLRQVDHTLVPLCLCLDYELITTAKWFYFFYLNFFIILLSMCVLYCCLCWLRVE